MKKIVLLLFMVMLALTVAGCTNAESPEAQACGDLNLLNDAVRASQLAGPATHINEIIQLQTLLHTSWSDLTKSANGLSNPETLATVDAADEEMKSIPVATQGTAKPIALTSLNAQASIATDIITEFAPICLSAGY